MGVLNPVAFLLLFLWLLFLFFLHFFKPKPRILRFPSLFFIKKLQAQQKQGFFGSFYGNFLFFLQLFLIFVLTFAFADPWTYKTMEGANQRIVVDTSASMSAQDYSHSRLQEAKMLLHRENVFSSETKIFSWNRQIHETGKGALGVHALEESLLGNSSLETLYDFFADQGGVLVTDSLDTFQIRSLANSGVDVISLGKNDFNLFFEEIFVDRKEEKLGIYLKVGGDVSRFPAELKIFTQTGRQASFALKKQMNLAWDIQGEKEVFLQILCRHDFFSLDNGLALPLESLEDTFLSMTHPPLQWAEIFQKLSDIFQISYKNESEADLIFVSSGLDLMKNRVYLQMPDEENGNFKAFATRSDQGLLSYVDSSRFLPAKWIATESFVNADLFFRNENSKNKFTPGILPLSSGGFYVNVDFSKIHQDPHLLLLFENLIQTLKKSKKADWSLFADSLGKESPKEFPFFYQEKEKRKFVRISQAESRLKAVTSERRKNQKRHLQRFFWEDFFLMISMFLLMAEIFIWIRQEGVEV